ncbi:DeoR/GlpR family DNA-binding transcription regulator [Nesterenkonia sp. HG001]|uniref:DeoR/GlpR family DNA-binding transcription regulator n=1 Tax=Nesterenkonia sp. HG001 TaxID=2983207 RepID=UPI002AC652B1|nr:DeoR/GlpR family DNA-binding transcription regulator [Nesterenkonia sp. HG001]MDZ5077218.1 DeoR/GlpR family DNA-binding transcription regulator [Nesterenkonia sp. HG001]
MLAAQRQTRITEIVQSRGAVSVTELVDQFGVSDMTIRRDLDALAGRGLVVKVHGGAVLSQTRRTEEPGFEVKSVQMEAEKASVAEEAAQLVQPGTSVALSAGTTTWALARRLRAVEDLTVVTNSTRISDVFQADPRPDRTVILTGGVRTPSDALVGPLAAASLRTLHVDLAFLGAHGVAVPEGFTTPNFLEAETNRALLATAQRRIVLADHSKWGVLGISTFAELADVDTVILDDALSEEAAAALRDHIDEVILVGPRPLRREHR